MIDYINYYNNERIKLNLKRMSHIGLFYLFNYFH
ncbi:IS3 family transposase [Flavobacterium sp. '19STA2R22 D10 B1']